MEGIVLGGEGEDAAVVLGDHSDIWIVLKGSSHVSGGVKDDFSLLFEPKLEILK